MKALAAIKILRAAVERSRWEPVKTMEVKAALVALKPHVTRDILDWFWGCTDSENDIGRSQNTRASFQGMLRQLGLPEE